MARGNPKGVTGNPNGRPKGTPNKTTIEFKEAVNNLLAYAAPEMVKWMQSVANDDPNKALDHAYKFAQFGYPLLARAELTGKDGDAIKTEAVLPENDKAILEHYFKTRGSYYARPEIEEHQGIEGNC